MDLSKRDFSQPYICKILLAFSGSVLPASGSPSQQVFYDSEFSNTDFQEVYNTKGKASFVETGEQTRAGMVYEQEVQMMIPSGDRNRSIRLSTLQKAKFIALGLTSGRWLVIGRNDVFQNASPKIKSQSNSRFLSVKFTVNSMFPCGFSNLQSLQGFPYLIPTL